MHESETDEFRAHGTGASGDGDRAMTEGVVVGTDTTTVTTGTSDHDAAGTRAVGIAAMQGRSPAKRSSNNANSGSSSSSSSGSSSKRQKTTVTT